MEKSKNGLLINAAITAILGVLFLIISPSNLMNIAVVIIGIFIIVANAGEVILGLLANDGWKDSINFISACISMIIGFVLIFFHNQVLNLIVAIYFIVLPIVRILYNTNKKEQLKKELPQLLIGILLLVFGPWSIIDILFKITGGILLVVALITIVNYLFAIKKAKKENNVLDAKIVSEKDV